MTDTEKTQRVIPFEEIQEILASMTPIWYNGLGWYCGPELHIKLEKAARFPWEYKKSEEK